MYCDFHLHSDQRFSRRRQEGFSLIEILIVVVIIGLLAGTVTLTTKYWVGKARYNRAKTDIRTIVISVENFNAEHGRYPGNSEGLAALQGITLRKDPWGNEYEYISPGATDDYDIICYGADGVEGGDGINADITDDMLDKSAPQ